jgi:hypothetical protein
MTDDDMAMLTEMRERWAQKRTEDERKIQQGLAKRFAILLAGKAHNTDQARWPAQEAVAAFATLDIAPLVPILDSVRIERPGSDGYSIKPTNVRLNLLDFFKLLGSGWLALTGEWGDPVRVFAAFLILCSDLLLRFRVELSRHAAAVIWTMWQKRNPSTNDVDDAGLLEAVNDLLQRYGDSPMSDKEYQACITFLLQIQTIKRADDDRWRICESVTVDYRY